MTHDRTIELWERAGLVWSELGVRDRLCIEEFVKLIRADEREACAKVCDAEGLLWGERYAAAIRSRA